MALKFSTAKSPVPVFFLQGKGDAAKGDAAKGDAAKAALPEAARRALDKGHFKPAPGRHFIVQGDSGAPSCVLFGVDAPDAARADAFAPGKLVDVLPAGDYAFANAPPDLEAAALAFLLQSYRFTRYKKSGADLPRLVAPAGVDARRIESVANAVAMVRDLVNTPANDLGPAQLEAAALDLAGAHKAKAKVIRGDALLKANFPLIHAVGRASVDAPRIVDFTWGPPRAPKVTLVGKGVCFDTGGLDIKPSSSMLLMKKDMGGAATALGLARMVMERKLKVRLRVILPIVENSISGNAFRPGDIFPSRKGLSVEIGNTDAEGRLILADALALAEEDRPDLLFDFATLTGAARVALGPELPALFSHDDALATALTQAGTACGDPMWRMPLWAPYSDMLKSTIADINNAGEGGFAGAVTAALFLDRFVGKETCWAHVDLYAWNPSSKPGRPKGGAAMTLAACFGVARAMFSSQ